MDERVEELPSSIDKLIHLRFLSIYGTRIQHLPYSIGGLYHLQTLGADNYYVKELPNSVQYLISLRHLHVLSGLKLPPNIGRLTFLQTLEYYRVGEEEGHKIGELGRLKNLQGDLHIFNLENVHDQVDAEGAFLFEKQKLCKLVLEWSWSREGGTNEENVLEGLRPHPNLKVLEIIRFKGTRFPLWIKGLHNLMEVSLKDCNECEEISMMGHLPHLKSLSLYGLRKVKSIHSSFTTDSSCKEGIVVMFPVLKRLTLSNMPKLVEWIEIKMSENEHPLEIKVFPCLEELMISKCRELRMDPSESVELKSGLHICGFLKRISLLGVSEVEYLPNWFFLNNKNLSNLSIGRCEKLRELPDGLHTLNSLKVLDIKECPNLKSIPYRNDGESQGLSSLESLSISNCEGLISLASEMIESCAPSLWQLTLQYLNSLISFPLIIDPLPKMYSLNTLKIWNVPKLISPPTAIYPNLQYLRIKPYYSDSSESAKKGVDGMLQAASPHSLTILNLGGMEDWDSLPHSLQHLNALYHLQLQNLRIEELPEWFGDLTSLQSLELWYCKELRSVESIRCLNKLTRLYISGCHPEIKSWIQQHKDNVSHIPNIVVEGERLRQD